jgi:hypothetical protein
MSKKTIDMVAMTPQKANAQNLVCFATFVATSFLSVMAMLIACVLPAIVTEVTAKICWTSMACEAGSLFLGVIAYWIKKNSL